jgi:hypothetical protein
MTPLQPVPKKRRCSSGGGCVRRYLKHFTVSLALCALMVPDLLSQENTGANQWVRSADMLVARTDACSVALADGRVLVAGGSTPAGALNVVELYRTDGTFTMAASLLERRAGAACVGLPDGRVLVTGGSDGISPLSGAEVFDPERNTWTSAGNMSIARTRHQATLTPWGSVLITGGDTDSGLAGRVEIYQPDSGQFQTVGTLSSPRKSFALAILPERRVLIAGGTDGRSTLAAIDIYDAATGSITPAGSMLEARRNFAASTLLDGRVLITGGLDADGKTLGSTEIFDPSRNSSVAGSPLSMPRAGHTSYNLPHNANVLLVGGANDLGILASTEMFLPWGERYSQTAPMNVERSGEAAAILRPGSLMVAGGKNRTGYLASSELYRFATIETDRPAYTAGEMVAIAGAGWTPGELVSVQATDFSAAGQTIAFSGQARADEAGRIALDGFKAPQQRSGMRVLLTATGTQSLAQAPVNLGAILSATITVAVTPSPSALGQPLSVTVTATGSGGTPTGQVKLVVDNTSYGSFITLTSGSATIPIPDPTVVGMGAPAATHTVGVTYTGDGNYQSQAASANQVNQVVQPGPWVVSTLPASGSGSVQAFALTVGDGGGPSNIANVFFMVNPSISAFSSCFVFYNRGANALYLMNDAGTAFQGPITPGSPTANAPSAPPALRFPPVATTSPLICRSVSPPLSMAVRTPLA